MCSVIWLALFCFLRRPASNLLSSEDGLSWDLTVSFLQTISFLPSPFCLCSCQLYKPEDTSDIRPSVAFDRVRRLELLVVPITLPRWGLAVALTLSTSPFLSFPCSFHTPFPHLCVCTQGNKCVCACTFINKEHPVYFYIYCKYKKFPPTYLPSNTYEAALHFPASIHVAIHPQDLNVSGIVWLRMVIYICLFKITNF